MIVKKISSVKELYELLSSTKQSLACLTVELNGVLPIVCQVAIDALCCFVRCLEKEHPKETINREPRRRGQ